ncbi:MAG: TolC family protein, partial [Flavipsychrobacter sp.]
MFKRFIHIGILLLSASIAEGQVIFKSIDDAWRYADAHNITIRSSQLDLQKANYTKKQSYSALLPQASANGSYTDNLSLTTTFVPLALFDPNAPAGAVRPVQFGQQYIYNGGVSAQMDILNVQNWLGVRIAKEAEAMSRDSLANMRKSVYQQIASQYYSYLLMKEAARLAGQSAALSDSVYQSAANKFKEGTVNEASVNTAKLNTERAEETYITANYQMQTAANNLKALLNMSLSDSLTIESSLENELVSGGGAAFTEDPQVRLAMRRVTISLNQYRSTKASFIPVLTVLYNYSTQQNDTRFEPFDAAGPAWYPAQYWSLRATWPLFTGGNRYFQTQKNKINYEESKLLYENVQKQSAINDANLQLGYEKASAVMEKSKDVMNLSFENYKHASYRYEAGIAPIDDRLNAFNDYITYQNQYLNNLSDL